MDLKWIRWRLKFGDGLPFLSPAVSGEVSPETVCPGSSQHPRDIFPFIARLHLLIRCFLVKWRFVRCIVLRALQRL